MPEGHTIHRYARLHSADLLGHTIEVSSPQGRFAEGAKLLDGQEVSEVEAAGKHLFYHWADGRILHVHLGLFGKFFTYRKEPPEPTDGTRLAMSTGDATIYLSGPTACDVLNPDERVAIINRLGPDPLRPRPSYAEFSKRLDRRKSPIAAALLDQAVVAGIGNVYRAEVLFLAGIHPLRSARDLNDEERKEIWDTTRQQLRRGEKAGRIVTVDPSDVGARSRSALDNTERLYVYHRHEEPCRKCGTPISLTELANRKLWWCPTCQPE